MKFDLLWRFSLPKERSVQARAPVVTDDRVYQVFHYEKKGRSESVLLAFNLETGNECWRAGIAHCANAPVVGPDGTIYVSSFEGSVIAYDQQGRQRWRAPEAARNLNVACLAGPERVVVAEIHNQGGHTWCLDAANGDAIWMVDHGGHAYPPAATASVVVHATVHQGASFGQSIVHLMALSAEDGRLLWLVESAEYLFTPTIVGDLVIIGARGSLRAYRIADGKLAACLDLPPDATINQGMLALSDGFVFGDTQGMLRRASLLHTGTSSQCEPAFRECWVTALASEPTGRPADLGSAVGVLLKSGMVQVVALRDGSTLASLKLGSGASNGYGGVARSGSFIAAAHGRLLALYRLS